MQPLLLVVLVLASSSAAQAQNVLRIGCHLLSDRAVFRENDWYRAALYLSKLQMQQKGGRCGYQQLADLHGRLTTYDGVTSQFRSGFCPHASHNFCAWHRFYACAVEDCLREACYEVVPRFTTTAAQTAFRAACDRLALPYWDWTLYSNVCTFATDTAVSVRAYTGTGLQNLPRNPWRDFVGCVRASNTATATCRSNMASFISSRNENCLTTAAARRGTTRCASTNLEGCHDAIHVNVGGCMRVVPDAPRDPIFQLHHTTGDYLVWRYQQARGRFVSAGLRPWQTRYTNATDLRCGQRAYSYYTGTTYPFPNVWASSAAVAPAGAAGDVAAAQAEAAVVAPALELPTFAQAQAEFSTFVARTLQAAPEWTWYYQVPEVHCNQVMQAWTVHLLFKGRRMPTRRGAVNLRALRALPNYCGAQEMLTCVHNQEEPAYVDVSIDLNTCLRRMGRRTQVGFKVPGKPQYGPDTPPCKTSDFVVLILDPSGKPLNLKLTGVAYIEYSHRAQAGAGAAAAAAAAGTVDAADLLGGVYESTSSAPLNNGTVEVLVG